MATVYCATTTALAHVLKVLVVPLRRIFRHGELALVLVHCCTRCTKLPRLSTVGTARLSISRALLATATTGGVDGQGLTL